MQTNANKSNSFLNRSVFYLVGILFLTGSLVYSCQKTVDLGSDDHTYFFNGIKFFENDGLLQFQSKKDFQFLMESQRAGEADFSFLLDHFPSMEDKIQSLSEEIYEGLTLDLIESDYSNLFTAVIEQDTSLEYSIDAKIMRELVNVEGNIVIEDTLYHITYYNTYIIPFEQFTTTSNVISDASRIFKIQRSTELIETRGKVHRCEDVYGGSSRKQKRRLRGELWDYDNFVYQEVSIGVENSDKNFVGIWKSDDATHLKMKGNYKVLIEFNNNGLVENKTHTSSIDESAFHEDQLEKYIYTSYFSSNSLHVKSWTGTYIEFYADEKDDSEVSHTLDSQNLWRDEAWCTKL